MTGTEAASNGRSRRGAPAEKKGLSISLEVLGKQNSVMGRIKEGEEKRVGWGGGRGDFAGRSTMG